MTKALIALGAGILLAATTALAQPAGPPDGGARNAPPDQHGPAGGKLGRGPGFGMHRGFRMHKQEPPSKGAQFRLRQGDRKIFVKCADDDSTKACIDAIGPLLNKLFEMK